MNKKLFRIILAALTLALAVPLFALVFGVKEVGVGPTWGWQEGVGGKCVRHLWARVDSEKEGVFE